MRVHGEVSNYLILTFKTTNEQNLYQYLWLVVKYCIEVFFGANVCVFNVKNVKSYTAVAD